ncbi:hypothetical protein RFI_39240, partial [Reticulomyxa filosa]
YKYYKTIIHITKYKLFCLLFQSSDEGQMNSQLKKAITTDCQKSSTIMENLHTDKHLNKEPTLTLFVFNPFIVQIKSSVEKKDIRYHFICLITKYLHIMFLQKEKKKSFMTYILSHYQRFSADTILWCKFHLFCY